MGILYCIIMSGFRKLDHKCTNCMYVGTHYELVIKLHSGYI